MEEYLIEVPYEYARNRPQKPPENRVRMLITRDFRFVRCFQDFSGQTFSGLSYVMQRLILNSVLRAV